MFHLHRDVPKESAPAIHFHSISTRTNFASIKLRFSRAAKIRAADSNLRIFIRENQNIL